MRVLWAFLFYGWGVSELGILLATRTRQSSGTLRDRGSLLLLWPTITASVACSLWIGAKRPPTMFGGADWVLVLALAMLVAGLAIRWAAILTLGRSFSANVAIHATQRLHRSGMFSVVRHPSYTGLLLIFAAAGVHTRNWWGLAVMVVPPGAALLYRIHVEEQALGEAFAEYAEYSRATKRIVPGLY